MTAGVPVARGAIYWANLGPPRDHSPAKARPVVIIQSDSFNQSRLATVLAATITSNTNSAAFPGNVFLPAASTGLARDSAVNVTALMTIDRVNLGDQVGRVPHSLMVEIDAGLRLVLGLGPSRG